MKQKSLKGTFLEIIDVPDEDEGGNMDTSIGQFNQQLHTPLEEKKNQFNFNPRPVLTNHLFENGPDTSHAENEPIQVLLEVVDIEKGGSNPGESIIEK